MSFSGKTILVPESYDLPDNIAFFKVIKDDSLLMKSVYVSPKNHYSPISARVAEIDIYYDKLMFLVIREGKKHFDGVNTDEDYIMEEDEIDSVLQINFENILKTTNHDMENRLIQEIIRDPSIFKKIPQELKDKPSFKGKVDLENIKRTVRALDTIGDRTGTVDFSNTVLSHDNSHLINELIFGKINPEDLHEAKLEKSIRLSTRRPIPTPPIPTPAPNCSARQTYKESNCSIQGGKRKRNRTRKNKKKKYGRL